MKKIMSISIALFAAVLIAAGSIGAQAAEDAETATLSPGKSYRFVNTDADGYYYVVAKNPISQASARYEYVNYDARGAVESYGSLSGSFLISGGGSAHLTITGQTPLTVEYAGHVKVSETERAALFTYTAAEGKSVLITNNEEAVPYSATISATSVRRLPKYDYILKNPSGAVTEYFSGSESTGLDIAAGGGVYVTPVEGAAVISLPYVWAENLTFTERAEAALSYYTLAPGKTFVIGNSDSDFNYNIANDSGAPPVRPKFEYVSRDAYGGVTAFETESHGDVFVPAEGQTTVTAKNGAPLTLWAPSEWTRSRVSFAVSDEPALFYHTVAPGKTVSIKNSDASNSYSLTANNTGEDLSPRLNYLYKDSSKLITDYGNELNGGAVYVPDGGETVITVTNGYSLTLGAPYDWGASLSFAETRTQALYNVALYPGESLELVNLNADMPFVVSNDGGPDALSPKFDYVFKDDAGNVTDYGRADLFGEFRLEGGGYAVLTAGRSRMLRLWFPYEWLGKSISAAKTQEPAVYEYRLGPGGSASITNLRGNTASIATNSGRPFSPKIDYVLRDAAGRITACRPAGYYDRLTLEGFGAASVTAGRDFDLRLTLPDEWVREGYVVITETEEPSVFYKTLASGQSAAIVNRSAGMFADVSVLGGGSSAHDYVRKDGDENIIDFGLSASSDAISVAPGGSYSLTVNRGRELELYMPYEWLDGAIAFVNAPQSVYSLTVKAGESVEITNADRNYAYAVSTDAADPSVAGAPSFDYVGVNSRDEITGYGSGDIRGPLTVPEQSRVTLTVRRGSDLKIWFPYEWHSEKHISIAKKPEPALFALTVPSGRTAEIANRRDIAFNIKNNSGSGLTDPKYDYASKQPEQAEFEEKLRSGEIAVPPMAKVTVRAANGYDLRLWLPNEWLKDLAVK